MIRKIKPDLVLYLAEEALKNKYSEQEFEIKEIMEIQKNCRDYMSVGNARKIYARMMKIEVTRIMVEVVYQSLTKEEQKFVELKYKKNEQLVAISLALHVSVAQLMIWQKNILEKIAACMLYKLNAEDVFERKKVINMVNLLSRVIEFANSYDPKHEFITKSWVIAITDRHEKYEKLLSKIDETLSEEKNKVRKEVIAKKIENPHETIGTLAKMCNIDKSMVSRYLSQFSEETKKYIE